MIRDKRAKLIVGTIGVSLLLIVFPMLLQMFGIVKGTSHLTFWDRAAYRQTFWAKTSSLADLFWTIVPGAIFGIVIVIVGLKLLDWWDKDNKEYYVQNFPFALLCIVFLYFFGYYLFMLFKGFL